MPVSDFFYGSFGRVFREVTDDVTSRGVEGLSHMITPSSANALAFHTAMFVHAVNPPGSADLLERCIKLYRVVEEAGSGAITLQRTNRQSEIALSSFLGKKESSALEFGMSSEISVKLVRVILGRARRILTLVDACL